MQHELNATLGQLPAPARAGAGVRALARAARAGMLLALLLIAGGAATAARGADAPDLGDAAERLLVTDPYVEMHTGPGHSFPVFYVVARDEWIDVLMRHTDWYKVRTASGKVGWIDRHQLENTLTQAGTRKTFRDVLIDDYLSRRLEFGGAWGHFESEPVLKLFASYNITDTIGTELTFGEVQGQYSGTNFWQVDVYMQPWSEKRLSPFFGVGVGRLDNVPNASLVGAINTNANSANAMIGLRYHVTDRLIARLDWTAYTSLLSANQTAQFHAITLGLSFFFY